MLSLVIDKCAELLAGQPDSVLPPGSIGAKRPASGAEVPAIALALTIEDTRGSGLGRSIRSGGRDDILRDTYRGTLTLEVWADQIDQADEIARKLQARLKTDPALLRQKGFISLQPASLDPAEHVLYAPPAGSPFPVWQQRIGYRFVFEYEEGEELSGGAPIKQIDVDISQPPESFSVR